MTISNTYMGNPNILVRLNIISSDIANIIIMKTTDILLNRLDHIACTIHLQKEMPSQVITKDCHVPMEEHCR